MSKATSPDADGTAEDWDWLERNARRLDFSLAMDGESWERATEHRRESDVDRVDEERWRVQLPDGDEHQCIIVADDDDQDGYAGACDCKGYQYQPAPCAHLSVIAQMDVLDEVVRYDPERAGELESEHVDVEHVDHGAGDDQEDDVDTSDDVQEIEAQPVDATSVQGGEPQGSDPEDRPAPARETADPPETPSDPFAGGLEDVPDEYVMTLGGDQYIRRAGYARLAYQAGLRIDPEEVVGAHETDWSRAKYRVRVLDEDGAVVATNVGTAHADYEDMDGAEANLDELALTRAATRALAWATGEGITAVAEVAPDQEPHQ